MFRDKASGEISERYEAIRILDGDDETVESNRFCTSYGIDMTPTLLAVGPDGRHVARLHGGWFEDVGDVLRFMADAERQYQRILVEERRLVAASDVASRRTLARFYVDHYQNREAQPLLEQLVRTSPRPLEHELLVSVLNRLEDVPAYRAALATLIAEYPDAPSRIYWEIRLALADLPRDIVKGEARIQRYHERIRILEGLLEHVTAAVDRAAIHGWIAVIYGYLVYFPEAPADTYDLMERHHELLVQDAVLAPSRVDMLIAVGYALRWAQEVDRELMATWLETAAKVPEASLTPYQAAELWTHRESFRRYLEENPAEEAR